MKNRARHNVIADSFKTLFAAEKSFDKKQKGQEVKTDGQLVGNRQTWLIIATSLSAVSSESSPLELRGPGFTPEENR
jgi:hypothetical protein